MLNHTQIRFGGIRATAVTEVDHPQLPSITLNHPQPPSTTLNHSHLRIGRGCQNTRLVTQQGISLSMFITCLQKAFLVSPYTKILRIL